MSSFTNNIARLMAWRGFSFIFGILTAPLISRLYSPIDFGIFGLVISISAWISTFNSLGYAQAIPKSKNEKEAVSLIVFCLFITLILIALVIAFTIFYLKINTLFNVKAFSQYTIFVPILFCLHSFMRIVEYSLTTLNRFRILAFISFLHPNISRLVQIVLGLLVGSSAFFLISGQIVGLLSACIIAFITLFPFIFKEKMNFSYKRFKSLARKHQQFPKRQMWNNLINMSSQHVPIICIGLMFSVEITGHFILTQKILAIPMFIIGSSIGQVFYPVAAKEWEQNKNLNDSVKEICELINITCVFPLIVFTFLSPTIFKIYFGETWETAGLFASILAPSILINMYANPLSNIFLIRDKTAFFLKFSISLLVFRLLSLGFGYLLNNHFLFIVFYSCSTLIILCLQFHLSLKLGKIKTPSILKEMISELFYSIISLTPTVFIFFGEPNNFQTVILLTISSVIYYSHLLYRKPDVRDKLFYKIKTFKQKLTT